MRCCLRDFEYRAIEHAGAALRARVVPRRVITHQHGHVPQSIRRGGAFCWYSYSYGHGPETGPNG